MSIKKFIIGICTSALIVVSVGFMYNKVIKADAAITDCTAISGNLITNCSFEDEAVLPSGYMTSNEGFPTVFAGYTGLTNWSIITPGTGNVVILPSSQGQVPQGSRALDISGVIDPVGTTGLDGEIFGTGVQQIVTGLVSGQTYTLKFSQSHLSRNGIDFPSEIEVVVDGVSQGIFSHTPLTTGETIGDFIWTENTVTFTATSSSATIGFFNNSPTPDTSNGPGRPVAAIDNIILTQNTDATAPTVVLSTNAVAPVAGMFSVTATFSEPVTDFTLAPGDITLVNATVSNLSTPTNNVDGTQTYTFDVTPTVDGQVTQITVSAGAAIDAGSNPNTVSNTLQLMYDFTSPIISSVHIQSNNGTPTYATTGNVITLSYTLDDGATPVQKQTITIDGVAVIPVCVPSVVVVNGADCTATLTVPAGSPVLEGIVTFNISVNTGPGQEMSMTTDGSFVIVDRIAPIVTITSPNDGSTVMGVFNLTGTCESGLDVVITAGGPPSNYKPDTTPQITTPCINGTYSVALLPTGAEGTYVTIASIEQVDAAGNHSAPLDASYLIGAATPAHVITITGPVGVVPAGPTIITGACDPTRQVIITGTGFDVPGTTPCTAGTYSYPITITGNTAIQACQRYNISNNGEPAYTYNCANSSTTLPSVVTTGSGGDGGTTIIVSGGCIYGINGCNGTGTNYPIVPTQSQTVTTIMCPAFTQYLKQGMRDGTNGIYEVSKVQGFLNKYLGRSLAQDGVFGSQTKEAVKDFQAIHFGSILAPWMLSSPTGWWYQSTRSYANYLEGCTEGIVRLDNAVKVQDGTIVN